MWEESSRERGVHCPHLNSPQAEVVLRLLGQERRGHLVKECPVYARASRGNSFIFSVHVKSQERATTWLYRAAALIMEV